MKKYIWIVWVLGFIGCSDWLSIQPSDRIAEETAFSSLSGFKMALNGIYVDLNHSSLYGQALTTEMVEILAQRYDVNEENTRWTAFKNYGYTSASVLSYCESIWGKAYSLIANANLVLKNCEEHREVLPDDYYNLIRGEALALRALLHFDLFRLFGPVYAKDSLLSSIPYYKEFVLSVNPSLKGVDFMNNVIGDLREAKECLSEDPIISKGVAGDPTDVFKTRRNLRLNYYAVQGLLARAYLYTEQLDSAFVYAMNVIDVQERIFPWINRTTASVGVDPDRVFSSELLFASENRNIGGLFSSLFNAEILKINSLLGMRDDVIDYRFDYKGESDLRYFSSLRNRTMVNSVDYKIFNKYQVEVGDSLHSQLMPMIRVSEMYLMVAEILYRNGERAEGATYFNTLRDKRGLSGYGNSYIYYFVEEWWREFIGEGQLFFYFKRTMADEVFSASERYSTTSVKLRDYVLPIPNGENKYN